MCIRDRDKDDQFLIYVLLTGSCNKNSLNIQPLVSNNLSNSVIDYAQVKKYAPCSAHKGLLSSHPFFHKTEYMSGTLFTMQTANSISRSRRPFSGLLLLDRQ